MQFQFWNFKWVELYTQYSSAYGSGRTDKHTGQHKVAHLKITSGTFGEKLSVIPRPETAGLGMRLV